jgi:hypothetical protein
LKGAVARFWYITRFNTVLRAGTNCKKCDKQMHFIVRVKVRAGLRLSIICNISFYRWSYHGAGAQGFRRNVKSHHGD